MQSVVTSCLSSYTDLPIRVLSLIFGQTNRTVSLLAWPCRSIFHAGVYTRPDTRKFAAITALLHRFAVFLINAAALLEPGIAGRSRECRWSTVG